MSNKELNTDELLHAEGGQSNEETSVVDCVADSHEGVEEVLDDEGYSLLSEEEAAHIEAMIKAGADVSIGDLDKLISFYIEMTLDDYDGNFRKIFELENLLNLSGKTNDVGMLYSIARAVFENSQYKKACDLYSRIMVLEAASDESVECYSEAVQKLCKSGEWKYSQLVLELPEDIREAVLKELFEKESD